MRRILVVVLALVLVTGTSLMAAQAVPHKYDVKSGIVTMENVMQVGTMQIKQSMILYFDDYGIKECKETYTDGKLRVSYFSDGKMLYALNHAKKTAANKGKAFLGTELRLEFSTMGNQQDRDSGKVKKGVPMQIAGKECEVIEVHSSNGELTQYAGWKKVMVLMKSASTTIKAAKIEENAAVPASKFQVPAGYTLK